MPPQNNISLRCHLWPSTAPLLYAGQSLLSWVIWPLLWFWEGTGSSSPIIRVREILLRRKEEKRASDVNHIYKRRRPPNPQTQYPSWLAGHSSQTPREDGSGVQAVKTAYINTYMFLCMWVCGCGCACVCIWIVKWVYPNGEILLKPMPAIWEAWYLYSDTL